MRLASTVFGSVYYCIDRGTIPKKQMRFARFFSQNTPKTDTIIFVVFIMKNNGASFA